MALPTEDDSPDWPLQATEAIVGFVDNVKHKTTRPATQATRAAVYGIVILALGIPALVMLLAGLVHLLNYAIPYGVWLVYLPLGLFFSAVGLFMWRKRVE
jgi:FtsH-binding integral membrane protein